MSRHWQISAIVFCVVFNFFGLTAHSIAGTLDQAKLQVVDTQNTPIANAEIIIGVARDNPFSGNVLTTDSAGQAALPSLWTAALPVTISAEGYTLTTSLQLEPGSYKFRLMPLEAKSQIKVTGKTDGFGTLKTDDKLNFSIVTAGFAQEDLVFFDMNKFISPDSDEISVIFNDIQIPSNLTLPEQSENYIFPVEFDKPDYRLLFRRPGATRLTVIHGQFPFSTVVDELRDGKSLIDTLNHFEFLSMGQKDVSFSKSISGQDMVVNQHTLTNTLKVVAPDFANTDTLISLALNHFDQSWFATDVKRFAANASMNLKIASQAESHAILSILSKKIQKTKSPTSGPLTLWPKLLDRFYLLDDSDADRAEQIQMSIALQQNPNQQAPLMLPLVNVPSAPSNNVITLQVPTLPNGLYAAGMAVFYSELESFSSGDETIYRPMHRWQIWSANWMSQVQLPQTPTNKKGKYRWEAVFFAAPSAPAPGAYTGQPDMLTITHVTRNGLDL